MGRLKVIIEDLVRYETPVIAEFISTGWIQDILAKHLARKVSRKIARYNKRIDRDNFLKEHHGL